MNYLVALLAAFVGVAVIGSMLLFLRMRKVEAKVQTAGKGHLREQDVREIVKETIASTGAGGGAGGVDVKPLSDGLLEAQANIRKIADAFNQHIQMHNQAATATVTPAPLPEHHSLLGGNRYPGPKQKEEEEIVADEAEDTVGELPANGGAGASTMRRPIVSPSSPPSVPTPASPATTRRRSARIHSQDSD